MGFLSDGGRLKVHPPSMVQMYPQRSRNEHVNMAWQLSNIDRDRQFRHHLFSGVVTQLVRAQDS